MRAAAAFYARKTKNALLPESRRAFIHTASGISIARRFVADLRIGEGRLDTCRGIGSRMDLTQLITRIGLGLLGLTRSKNHAKAEGKYQKEAQDALFHFHHTFLSLILSIRQYYCIKRLSFCQHLFLHFLFTLCQKEKNFSASV